MNSVHKRHFIKYLPMKRNIEIEAKYARCMGYGYNGSIIMFIAGARESTAGK